MTYTFGDTERAARRLQILHDVFAASTGPFLREAQVGRPQLALDLGCGPGYTTHFLRDVLACEQVVGLDSSEPFLALARRTATDSVSFYLHDVRLVPFPVGPADLLFCRLLLTHLSEPQAVVRDWATQLRPKGLLLMEEVEWIDTEHAVLRTYLDILQAMLEQHSNTLYVGPILNALEEGELLRRHSSQVRRLTVSNARAATMFHLNIQTWRQQPFILENYSPSLIDGLEQDLWQMAQQSNGPSEIEWGMRQLVLERR